MKRSYRCGRERPPGVPENPAGTSALAHLYRITTKGWLIMSEFNFEEEIDEHVKSVETLNFEYADLKEKISDLIDEIEEQEGYLEDKIITPKEAEEEIKYLKEKLGKK